MDKMIQNTLRNLDESIEEMNKKKDFTSSDLDILCKAYKLKRELEGDMGMDGSYDSSYGMNTRHYSNGDWHAEGSYAPMRSPVTGRYISRDRIGMSGHSIKDRMVAKLEEMYDDAKTEHEREEVRKEIRRIESEMM